MFFGLLFSLLCTVLKPQLMALLGVTAETYASTDGYMLWTVSFGAMPAILNVVMAYLVRAEGSALHASIGTMSGCLLNIALDPIFVLPWGLDMGAAGAGLATFISNCVACGYFFVLLYARRRTTCVCIKPSAFTLRREVVAGVCAVGVPASIQNLLNVTGMTVLTNFTAAFGADPVAAMGIAQKISMVPMYISQGISQGIMPLISYNYASGNVPRMRRTLTFAMKISLSFQVVVALFFFFDSEFMIRLFMANESVIGYGAAFLKGMCLAMPFLCMDFLAVGVFQATGMGGKAFLFAILRKVVLEIPALIALNRIFPLYGLAYAQLFAEVILATVAAVVLVKLFRRLSERRAAP